MIFRDSLRSHSKLLLVPIIATILILGAFSVQNAYAIQGNSVITTQDLGGGFTLVSLFDSDGIQQFFVDDIEILDVICSSTTSGSTTVSNANFPVEVFVLDCTIGDTHDIAFWSLEIDGALTCVQGSCEPCVGVVCQAGDGVCEAGASCNPGNGLCEDLPDPNGTACGDGSSGTCDNADTCNGAGVCQDNNEPTTTTCGDGDAACVNQDFCGDGTGLCEDNGFKSAGTACGDGTSGVCDNADTCNDSGVCQDNFEPTDTVCRPDAGVCDVADFCDGSGTCDPDAFEPAGTACTCNVGPGECDGSNVCVGFVLIDVKPGSDPNSINTKSNGVVPVAILGSATFDVTDVDVTTLAFGPNAAAPAHDLTDPVVYALHLQDVNSDGFTDLVSHYKQKQTGILCGNTEATLTGNHDGQPIEGTDSVRPVPCK